MQRFKDILGFTESNEERELSRLIQLAQKQINSLLQRFESEIDSSEQHLSLIDTLGKMMSARALIDASSPVHDKLKDFLTKNYELISACIHELPTVALQRQIELQRFVQKNTTYEPLETPVSAMIQMNAKLLLFANNDPSEQSIRSFVNGLMLLEKYIRATYNQSLEDNQEYVEFITRNSDMAIDLFSQNPAWEHYLKAWLHRLKVILDKQKSKDNSSR